jgi:hypothetical protein
MMWPQVTGVGSHNFCRNPTGLSGGAWCYTNTTDAGILWEYCDVPNCRDNPGALNAFAEYKITWTAIRNPGQLSLQFAEIEIPGLLGEEHIMPSLELEGEYMFLLSY